MGWEQEDFFSPHAGCQRKHRLLAAASAQTRSTWAVAAAQAPWGLSFWQPPQGRCLGHPIPPHLPSYAPAIGNKNNCNNILNSYLYHMPLLGIKSIDVIATREYKNTYFSQQMDYGYFTQHIKTIIPLLARITEVFQFCA